MGQRMNWITKPFHALADAKVQVWEEISADPYAATRRAIVRAAAEIGRNMK